LQALCQFIRLRALHHERQVIVAPSRFALESGVRGQVQNEVFRDSQGDEGALAAPVLFEAERLQAQSVSIEA